MNRSTVAALVVALMLGSGVAGYLIGKPGEFLDRPAPSQTATATPPASSPATPTGPQSAAPVPISQPAATDGMASSTSGMVTTAGDSCGS